MYVSPRYLLKPSDASWEDGIIGLEAGSGPGALSRILRADPQLFRSEEEGPATTYTARQIYSFVTCFLVTHAHLDHISSLVLSAGSLGGGRKRICATSAVLKDIETAFSNRLWPNLASWDKDDSPQKYLYTSLQADSTNYNPLLPQISVRPMTISHGCNNQGEYDSTAFFLKHNKTGSEFLFFGDVESDVVSSSRRGGEVAERVVGGLGKVWKVCAPKIPLVLSAIFIECSWAQDRPDALLFGHLKPEHLVNELKVLAEEVTALRRSRASSGARAVQQPARKKRRKINGVHDIRGADPHHYTPLAPFPPSSSTSPPPLAGVRIFITHCKEDFKRHLGANREIILSQVKALVEAAGLGVEVHAVKQGERIGI